MTPRGPRLLIGIGLNVATRLGDAPAEVGRMAVALARTRARPLDVATTSKASCARSSIGSVRSCRGWRSTIRNCRSAGIASTPCAVGGCGSTSGPGSWPGSGAGIDAEGALCLAVDRETVRIVGGRVLREPGFEMRAGVTHRHVTPARERWQPSARGQRAVASALSRPTPAGGFWFVQSIRIGVAM